jgi:RNA polymerase sigma factor (sigma-70 family)
MRLTPEQSQKVEDNLGLAYYALNKYRKHFDDFDPEELLSACYIGLVKAAQGFDPDKGKFSTYAMKTMYSTIIMELIRGKKQVKPIYLEEIVNKEDHTFWQDIVGSGESTEDDIIHKILGEQIIDALDSIKMGKICKKIIKTHYYEPGLTQKEIAKKLGCSQKNVSLAYGEARKKLRPMVCMG